MLHGAAPYAVRNIGRPKKSSYFPLKTGRELPQCLQSGQVGPQAHHVCYIRYLYRSIDRYIRLAFQGLSLQHVVSCVQHIAHVPPTCRVRRDLRRWAEISAI